MLRSFIPGLMMGLCLFIIFCLGATYTTTTTVPVRAYTTRIDPNDRIYAPLSIRQDWITKFGDCERTLVFYNIAFNRARIIELEKRMAAMEKLCQPVDPNVIPDTVRTGGEPNH